MCFVNTLNLMKSGTPYFILISMSHNFLQILISYVPLNRGSNDIWHENSCIFPYIELTITMLIYKIHPIHVE